MQPTWSPCFYNITACLISNLLHISNINIRVTLTVYLIIDSAEQCETKWYFIGFIKTVFKHLYIPHIQNNLFKHHIAFFKVKEKKQTLHNLLS